jgi:hypothetical protein
MDVQLDKEIPFIGKMRGLNSVEVRRTASHVVTQVNLLYTLSGRHDAPKLYRSA